MDKMDWGEVLDFVKFGNVGADQIDDSQYYIIIAPQNVVGSTIMAKLLEMVRDQAPCPGFCMNGYHCPLMNTNTCGKIWGAASNSNMQTSIHTHEGAFHTNLCDLQADAAAAHNRTIIVLNPLLKDIPSASGVMGVRCYLIPS
jgi:hypothetical protein